MESPRVATGVNYNNFRSHLTINKYKMMFYQVTHNSSYSKHFYKEICMLPVIRAR
jgi:hypothetical protein